MLKPGLWQRGRGRWQGRRTIRSEVYNTPMREELKAEFSKQGWDDPFIVDGKFWGFSPGNVMPTPIPKNVLDNIPLIALEIILFPEERSRSTISAIFEENFHLPDESDEIADPIDEEKIAEQLKESTYKGLRRLTGALIAAIFTLSLAHLILPTKEDIYRPIEPNSESAQSRRSL